MNPKQELQVAVNAMARHMKRELLMNRRKGDRKGWLQCEPMQLVLEVYYHAGKLQNAVKTKNLSDVREYAADVANMAMMVMDKCGVLGLPDINSLDKNLRNTEWTKKIMMRIY